MITSRRTPRAPRRLPVGTLTLVFTDIEGSTRLELAIGTDRYAALLDRHRTLLRAAWASGDGVEVVTEGDSFFVVFERPTAAVGAAVEGQRALAAEPWPADAPIRVRIGIHTGEVSQGEMGYVGTAINRAARIAASGHGGQVLLSAATRSLVGDALPDGVDIRDLGAHRLRDLPQPERLFQLVVGGLPSEFPPLRGQVGDSLPVQLTSFVGRESELAEAERLLATSRLLTLVGPGGTGKTRLAIALASRAADMFPDGVVFVPLAPIDDAMLVPATIARALSLADTGAKPAIEAVIEHIGDQRLLLVVDNFEQVLSAAPVIAEILRRTPNTTVLLTSRAVLHVSGEQEYEVPGLPAPPDVDRLPATELARLPRPIRRSDPDAIGRFEAVRLFVARARSVRPDFELDAANASAVARITARLHGMPLPIELAAARVKLRAPGSILERLDDQLGLLASSARDLPERQRSIRGAIAWSVDLLAPPERTLLARLGAFVGGFDLADVVAVAGGDDLDGLAIEDALAALVDQSLVRHSAEMPGHFQLLEPIREYAVELLAAAGELETRRDRQAERFLALAEEAQPRLAGDDQATWLDRLDAERDNLRAAVGWAIERPLPATALRLGSALWRFWQKRGYLDEGGARLTTMLAAEWSRDDPALRAKALEALGGIRYWQGRLAEATGPYAEATATWRELGDRRELANALYNESYARGVEEPQSARPLLDEATAIYRELDDDVGLGNVLWAAGTNMLQGTDAPGSEPLFAEARERFRRAGDRTMEAWADHMLGAVYAVLGRPEEAARTFGAALDHFEAVGDVSGIALSLGDFALAARALGQPDSAARLDLMAQTLARSIGANLLDASVAAFPGVWYATKPEDLPPGRYDEIVAEIAGLSLDEMVAYARSLPGMAGRSRDRER
ncbi:MAG TPA: adenylate/guanylate cyclase domain-containing protein [Candidatus Limnocylindrales bacterium]|nr:adenylate/guanylate cyclase domain-containing protein [Candidatus Limnocylindrales bacterium]